MSRAETLNLQKEFPKGILVEFRDRNGASRLGEVLQHKAGRILVLSPPHSRAGRIGITKPLWKRLVKRYWVDGDHVGLATGVKS